MGCNVKTNRHAYLALRLYWDGREWWEGLGLPDTKANRDKVGRIADAISAEIRARAFTPERYLHYFPHGNRAAEFSALVRPEACLSSVGGLTVGGYAELWLPRQQPPFVRPAQRRDYRRDINRYVLPARVKDGAGERRLGDIPLSQLSPRYLLDLRERLRARGLAPKTVRNIVDASFRAMVRDARTVDLLIPTDPFSALRWPRLSLPPPDPFTEDEGDRLLEWFFRHRRLYYPFVALLFLTGMRPSEAVALRWGDVDVARGTISIARSRYLGSEGAPKTPKSYRTIKVRPEVQAILRGLKPLRVAPDDYVFTNAENGGPINQSEWPKDHWNAALRGTGIRPRKFYATRHTFISAALTHGVNLKWLAEYCGTSVAMIERSYGRFLAESGESQLDLLGSVSRSVGVLRRRPDHDRKNRDLGGGVSVLRRKTLAK